VEEDVEGEGREENNASVQFTPPRWTEPHVSSVARFLRKHVINLADLMASMEAATPSRCNAIYVEAWRLWIVMADAARAA